MSKISGLGMVSQTTDYRLYDKKVIAAFCKATERERMFRGIMDWLGFRKVYVEFAADARIGGQAGYSYIKLYNLAISSITSFSLWPLRLTGYLGITITSLSGLLLVWMLASYALGAKEGFTPLAIVVVANTFLIGIVLMSIGLVALYIGTIHTEVINRPLYVVRERFSFDEKPENSGSSKNV
jgi:dolichol-phosphate mannosyltransferase